tara:strand:+ start:252 stop:1331 length:1080 start_codon:yes stop_codon:yes gene_type:complete
MGARSSNTNRDGSRSQSQNRLLNGHVANFFNSALNAGTIGPNQYAGIEASGGNAEFELNGYKYHLFRDPGTFTVTNAGSGSGSAEIVMIGGGGSGGYFYGDGGGAGGALQAPQFPLSTDHPYTCVVGEGGAGPPTSSNPGNVGEASEFYPTPAGPGEGANCMFARGGGGGGYKQAEPHPAPPSGFPWNPITGTGCGGGQHNGGTSEITPDFPTSTQHPAVTLKYSNRGGDQPYYNSNGSGGGGISGGGETNAAFLPSGGGNGLGFPGFPGPGMYDAMPSPEQSAWGGTTWRDTLSPSGSIGGGGGGWTTSPPPARSDGGGGWFKDPDYNGIDYTGSGGAGPSPYSGHGGVGTIWIRYEL